MRLQLYSCEQICCALNDLSSCVGLPLCLAIIVLVVGTAMRLVVTHEFGEQINHADFFIPWSNERVFAVEIVLRFPQCPRSLSLPLIIPFQSADSS